MTSEIVANSGILSKTRVHVDDTGGSGRPVVLIHGWPLSAEAWKLQTAALRDAGHRVVAYDRRGFGRSDRPGRGFDYDTLADDLRGVLSELDLNEVALVGFSMGGGEVARYIFRHGEDRLRSAVFASAVTPCLLRADDNPVGPLTPDRADDFEKALRNDRAAFFDEFTTNFFSVGGELKVSEAERAEAMALCQQSSQDAALGCMEAWATTDFRVDLGKITVPTLVLHGDGDAIVPFDGSAARTHAMVADSRLVSLPGAPHGCNTSHADAFNTALLEFLAAH